MNTTFITRSTLTVILCVLAIVCTLLAVNSKDQCCNKPLSEWALEDCKKHRSRKLYEGDVVDINRELAIETTCANLELSAYPPKLIYIDIGDAKLAGERGIR